MDIVGACLLDGFPTDNKLSLKTSKSAAKGEWALVTVAVSLFTSINPLA